MHEYQRLSRHGYAKLLQNRHGSMRRYFADFIQLPFLVEKGNKALEEAIHLIRKLDAKTAASIPDNIETNFIDYQIKFSMRNKNGSIKRNLWEIGVAIAIKDGFRSGDLFVSHSNKHVSFWNLIYKDNEWGNERDEAYQTLAIEQNAGLAVEALADQFHEAAHLAARRYDKDDFSGIKTTD